MADRIEQETFFRIESGEKFVTFRCSNRDDLRGAVALAATCLWDSIHPEDVPMRVEATKRQWREMEAVSG